MKSMQIGSYERDSSYTVGGLPADYDHGANGYDGDDDDDNDDDDGSIEGTSKLQFVTRRAKRAIKWAKNNPGYAFIGLVVVLIALVMCFTVSHTSETRNSSSNSKNPASNSKNPANNFPDTNSQSASGANEPIQGSEPESSTFDSSDQKTAAPNNKLNRKNNGKQGKEGALNYVKETGKLTISMKGAESPSSNEPASTTKSTTDGCEIFYRYVHTKDDESAGTGSVNGKNNLVLVLLHGAAFDSSTWNKLGTLDLHLSVPVIAIDLPGHGQSPKCSQSETETFRKNLVPEVVQRKNFPNLGSGESTSGDPKMIVVAPSMAGTYAFPALVSQPARFAGFVAVAPAKIEAYKQAISQSPELHSLPTKMFFGSKDPRVTSEKPVLEELFPNHKETVVYQGARHPCYLDFPGKWHADLSAFIASIVAGETTEANH